MLLLTKARLLTTFPTWPDAEIAFRLTVLWHQRQQQQQGLWLQDGFACQRQHFSRKRVEYYANKVVKPSFSFLPLQSTLPCPRGTTCLRPTGLSTQTQTQTETTESKRLIEMQIEWQEDIGGEQICSLGRVRDRLSLGNRRQAEAEQFVWNFPARELRWKKGEALSYWRKMGQHLAESRSNCVMVEQRASTSGLNGISMIIRVL